jgi:hypothetical protein
MPETDKTVTKADPTTGEGGPNGSTSGDVAGGAPAGATTTTVYQAMARVIAAMPAVPKEHEGPEKQGSYKYRGIEDVVGAAKTLLAHEGIVITPHAKLLEVRPGGSGGWACWVVEFTWQITGPRGDHIEPAPVTIGVGYDNTDKGVNKAQTQAFKYMLTAVLLVNDTAVPEPDAQGDYGRDEREAAEAAERAAAARYVEGDELDAIRARIGALPQAQKDQLTEAWCREGPDGEPYLPMANGKPATGLLRRSDVMAAEALIAAAEKAAQAEPTTEQRAAGLAERAASHASAPADAPAAPAEGTDRPEPETGPTAATPEGTAVRWAPDDDDWLPDLADEPIAKLALRVQTLGKVVPDEFFRAVTADVKGLHQSHVNREVTAVVGQTIAEDEHIDHRRMRVSLVRLLLERDRLAAEGTDRG